MKMEDKLKPISWKSDEQPYRELQIIVSILSVTLAASLRGWQCLQVGWSHHFGPDLNISTTIEENAMKFSTDIFGAWRKNNADSEDPLIFP